jgi:ATP synthase protein I
MPNVMPSVARRMLLTQLGLTGVIALLTWVSAPSALPSAVAGGGIAVATTLALALWVFVPYRAQETQKLVFRFYGAEFLKIALATILFAAALIWLKPLHPIALFGAFFVVQVIPALTVQRRSN